MANVHHHDGDGPKTACGEPIKNLQAWEITEDPDDVLCLGCEFELGIDNDG